MQMYMPSFINPSVFLQLSIYLLALMIIGFTLSNVTIDIFDSNSFFYGMIIVFPIILAFLFSFKWGANEYIILAFIVLAISVIYIFFYLIRFVIGSYGLLFMKLVANFILIIIFFLLLSIIYSTFNHYIRRLQENEYFDFAINLLFFVPCLLIDAAQYMVNDIRITPRVIFFLLAAEILCIFLYYMLPYILQKVSIPAGKMLQKEPVFLDLKHSKRIASSDDLVITGNRNLLDTSGSSFRRHYALEMLIHINPQKTDFEIPIFTYGDGTSNVKPKITYSYDSANTQDTYNIYFAKELSHSIHLPSQKWNHFIVNYHGDGADVFVNGNLLSSVLFTDMVPTYSDKDTITIGYDNNREIIGLGGAISNVMYYQQSLTMNQIQLRYAKFHIEYDI